MHQTMRTNMALVTQDKAHLVRVMAFEGFLFLLTLAALLGMSLLEPGRLRLVCSVLVGAQVGRIVLAPGRRALAYQMGWLHGRGQMVVAMAEAQRRGMSPTEWLEAELARDYAVMGVDPDRAAWVARHGFPPEGE